MKKLVLLSVLCAVSAIAMNVEEANQALMDGIGNNNLNHTQEALRNGADANHVNNHGTTPLYVAALLGCVAIVQLLLDHGADVNYRNYSDLYVRDSIYNGKTARAIAAEYRHYEIVKLLDQAAEREKDDERARLRSKVKGIPTPETVSTSGTVPASENVNTLKRPRSDIKGIDL